MIWRSDRARFSAIFAKRGLSLDFGTSWLLRQRIGATPFIGSGPPGRRRPRMEDVMVGQVVEGPGRPGRTSLGTPMGRRVLGQLAVRIGSAR